MKLFKIFIVSLMFIFGLVLTVNMNVKALDDYVTPDDETQYGWYLQGTEENKVCWEFDEDGELSYSYAADGDFGDSQHVNNFAIRNLAINASDTYSIQTTFVPDPDTNASIERTYGIVCWYQDADNYLIYWLQQKPIQWSGQFYGRVDGFMRYFYIPRTIGNIEVVNYFRGSEFADMWWDASTANNANLVGNVTALCSNTVTIKVESEVVTLELKDVWSDATESFNDEQYRCRKFTLHQIVNGDDFSVVYYIRDINENSGDFYTGLYSNGFNYAVEDFAINTTTTDFAKNVEATINGLPKEIVNQNQIALVHNARVQYEDLLGYKKGVSADCVKALEDAEASVGAFIDNAIMGLDNTVETYKDDVNAIATLFNGLSEVLQNAVSKQTELANHINAAKTWEYNGGGNTGGEENNPPTGGNENNPPTGGGNENNPPADGGAKKGCKKGMAVIAFLTLTLSMGVCFLRKRH